MRAKGLWSSIFIVQALNFSNHLTILLTLAFV